MRLSDFQSVRKSKGPRIREAVNQSVSEFEQQWNRMLSRRIIIRASNNQTIRKRVLQRIKAKRNNLRELEPKRIKALENQTSENCCVREPGRLRIRTSESRSIRNSERQRIIPSSDQSDSESKHQQSVRKLENQSVSNSEPRGVWA